MSGFLALPEEQSRPETARVHILPVPYDGTSTWHKGADAGPQALIDASGEVEFYDCVTGTEPCRHGIHTRAPIVWSEGPEGLADRVEQEVTGLLEAERLPVVLGGEHSVTIGAVRAMARHYPTLSVLQLDAHGDTRESYMGSTCNHACVMARVRELCPFVAVGIRALGPEEVPGLVPGRTFFAHDIMNERDRGWIHRVVAALSDTVYVTIDLDVFDPSLLPATGTPEPGGLGWYDVTGLLQAVTASKRVVGFDVVELCPQPGQHASAFVAAKLVHHLLALVLR